MKHHQRLAIVFAAFAALALVGGARADDRENDKAKRGGAVTTLWEVQKESEKVALLEQGKDRPITVTVSADTILGGICYDCRLFQQFKAGEAVKNCSLGKTCACDKLNIECLAWKPVKPKTWEAMLQALPRGIALRATYKEAGKPESGVKTLTVDRRTVLLPVEGLSAKTPEQLLALVKPIGGVKAEMVGNGNQLLIDLRVDWTLDREARFEKALADAGAKVAFESKSSQK